MKISFHKQSGNQELGIAFFWRLQIETDSPISVVDHFIPELFFDYFYIHSGEVGINDSTLPQQALKTLHNRPIPLQFKTPLDLFGARLGLNFADQYAKHMLTANRFLEVDWISEPVDSLPAVSSQITQTLSQLKTNIPAESLLKSPAKSLQESAWLNNYSPRHKRRLFKKRFGMSRKEMQTIQNVNHFLEQACDFSNLDPHIIDHVTDDHFYDQPHLSRAFKKVTGFTLLEYFEANTTLQDNLMAVSYKE